MKRDDPADQQRNPMLALLGDHVYFSQWHHVFQPSREDSHTVKTVIDCNVQLYLSL